MSGVVGQGGTIPLDARYRDGSGALVDPTLPLVDIVNPSAVTVVNDATPVHDGTGLFHYNYTVAVAAPLGTWTAHWTGVINGAPVSGDDVFTVVAAGSVDVTEPLLVPITEYRRITLDTTSTNSAISGALVEATGLVEEYLGRWLASMQRTETLAIDNWGRVHPRAVPITAVATTGLTIQGYALAGATADELTSFLIEPIRGSPAQATVTYTGGFTSATLPKTILRRIAWEAYAILRADQLAMVPSGAQAVSIGDASVTFGAHGPPGALSDETMRAIRPWRLQR